MSRRAWVGLSALAVVMTLMPPATGAVEIDTWQRKDVVGIPASGLAYLPATDRLLATVGGAHANLGNQLVELDPATGNVGRRVHVGSDPGEIELADDGVTAYVGLRGTGEVVRVNLLTFTVVGRIVLGLDDFSGSFYARNIEAVPGHPDTIVVSVQAAYGYEGVYVFDNGVARPDHGSGWPWADYIELASADRLYSRGFYGDFATMRVGPTGITDIETLATPAGFHGDIRLVDGRLYSAGGTVLDVETQSVLHTFHVESEARFGLSPLGDRIAYMTENVVSRFDTATGELVDTRRVDGLRASAATDVVSTGDGLAITAGQGLTLLGPDVGGPQPTLPAPPPSTIGDLKTLTLPFDSHSAVYDPLRHLVYVSVPHWSDSYANHVIAVDPDTGSVRRSLSLPDGPGPMAITDDASTLYVGLAAGRVVQVNLLLFLPVGMFSLGESYWGPLQPGDIAVAPGTVDTVAVARSVPNVSPSDGGVAVYRGGVQLPRTGQGDYIAFTDPSTLWGTTTTTSSYDLHGFDLGADGLRPTASTHHVLYWNTFKMVASNGVLYAGALAADPRQGRVLGRYASGGGMAPVPARNRMYTTNGTNIDEYELDTFRFVAQRPAPHSGQRTLVPTATGLASAGNDHTVLFSRSPLVPAPPAVHGFTPTSGPNGGGNVVTITGTGFTNAYSVNFGVGLSSGAPTFTVVSDTVITAVAPACCGGLVEVAISVTAPPGTGTSAARYRFEPPPSSSTTTTPTPTSTTTPTTTTTTTTTTTPPTPTTSTTTTTTLLAPPLPPPAAPTSGYWMAGADGRVYPFGDARSYGNAPAAVDLEPTASRRGYWVVDGTGNVHAFGDAPFLGGTPHLTPGESVTSLSRTASGTGYWLFTTRGRVLPYGDAFWHGDMGPVALNGPVLDSAPTPSGRGYYMVAADGGIFTFGDARFSGSMGGTPLNAPVRSLAPDPDGEGYWLVASDGGIFAFDAPFYGSMGGAPLNRPVTGMVGSAGGYLMVAEDGGIFAFGAASFHGSLGGSPPVHPVAAVATY